MKVSEIISAAGDEFGIRNQYPQSKLLLLLNEVQKIAFNRDSRAFLVTDKLLDIATQALPDPKGPYSFPTSPACRRFVGISTLQPQDILGIRKTGYQTDSDYGMFPAVRPEDPRNFYVPTVIDPFAKTYSFVDTPAVDDTSYRIVYYRRPEDIRSVSDDTRLLIPPEFHHTLCVQGIVMLADFGISGAKTPLMALLPYLEPFWEWVEGSIDPNETVNISEGTIGL